MGKSTIRMADIKQALRDPRFRDKLPFDYKESIAKYIENPSCNCNFPLYKKIIKEQQELLKEYFPTKEIKDIIAEEAKAMAENNWTVINCKANELEGRLRQLPPGRKQLAVARYGDEVTVVVNELGIIF